MIVAKTFTTDKEITEWLYDESNIAKLKEQYPTDKYHARLNLIDKQVEITEIKIV